MLSKYFNLTPEQSEKFNRLKSLYIEWNQKINLVSRKDIENIEKHHILHCLAISKFIQFEDNTTVMDVGTGGGLPGLPLAIMNPSVNFFLVDSRGKKITAVSEIANELGLTNVKTIHDRAENINRKFDYICGRAVTSLDSFAFWVKEKFIKKADGTNRGIIYLAGGEQIEAKNNYPKLKEWDISTVFDEDFFKEKKLFFVPF